MLIKSSNIVFRDDRKPRFGSTRPTFLLDYPRASQDYARTNNPARDRSHCSTAVPFRRIRSLRTLKFTTLAIMTTADALRFRKPSDIRGRSPKTPPGSLSHDFFTRHMRRVGTVRVVDGPDSISQGASCAWEDFLSRASKGTTEIVIANTGLSSGG